MVIRSTSVLWQEEHTLPVSDYLLVNTVHFAHLGSDLTGSSGVTVVLHPLWTRRVLQQKLGVPIGLALV